jgi:hypothetical protein
MAFVVESFEAVKIGKICHPEKKDKNGGVLSWCLCVQEAIPKSYLPPNFEFFGKFGLTFLGILNK